MAMGYTLNVSVIGIDEDNKYYETEPVKGKSSIDEGRIYSISDRKIHMRML